MGGASGNNCGVSHVHIVGVNQSDSVASAEWIRHHPVGFMKAAVRGWTLRAEASAILHGFVTPLRRFHQYPFPPLSVVFVWLAIARLVDPIPNLRRRRHGLASASSGEPMPTDATPIEDLAEAAGDEANEQTDGTAVNPVRDRMWSVALGVVTAAVVVVLIEHGLAIAADPVESRRIVWVQGRYSLPLLPLTFFGFGGVPTRVVPDRLLLVLPIVSAGFATWWLGYIGHPAHGWLCRFVVPEQSSGCGQVGGRDLASSSAVGSCRLRASAGSNASIARMMRSVSA